MSQKHKVDTEHTVSDPAEQTEQQLRLRADVFRAVMMSSPEQKNIDDVSNSGELPLNVKVRLRVRASKNHSD